MRLAHPEDVAAETLRLMGGFAAPWGVAGGWALDLFLGCLTRPHSDVELAVLRDDQADLHSQFEGWTFTVSVPDGRGSHGREAWRKDERLELPVHEIHASSRGNPPQAIEFLLNESDDGHWVFRRDRAIVRPLDLAFVETEFGVRALAPEIALLFKSKSPRPKDEADFRRVLDALSAPRRQWLEAALRRTEPGHQWLPSSLRPGSSDVRFHLRYGSPTECTTTSGIEEAR